MATNLRDNFLVILKQQNIFVNDIELNMKLAFYIVSKVFETNMFLFNLEILKKQSNLLKN